MLKIAKLDTPEEERDDSKSLTKKYLSREFVVFLIATGFCYNGNITGIEWISVSSLFIGKRLMEKLKGVDL
jgi:hypothetical protein